MLIKVWIAKHGAQIVIVTIPSLEGESLEEYATETFRKFGIGDKNKNNGLLILIALQERKSRIEVGYGLEGVLPDAKTGRIQNQYMLPYLSQNKWDEGIKNGFNEFVSIISKNYDVEIEQEKAEKVEKSPISDPLLVFSFSALAGYIMVIIPFSYEYYKPRKLLIILNRIVDNGDTVIVIEHNLDVIKVADYIIDLGPDGGKYGGEIVATGTPEEVAKTKGSYTGEILAKILK